jgi:hypothetical protein
MEWTITKSHARQNVNLRSCWAQHRNLICAGLWIFAGGRLIAFRSHPRPCGTIADLPMQARHAKILLCVSAFASKSGLNAVLC